MFKWNRYTYGLSILLLIGGMIFTGIFDAASANADQPLVGFGDAKLGMSQQDFLATQMGKDTKQSGNCQKFPTVPFLLPADSCLITPTNISIDGRTYYALFPFKSGRLQTFLVSYLSTESAETCTAIQMADANSLASRYGKFDGPPSIDRSIDQRLGGAPVHSAYYSTAIKTWSDRQLTLVMQALDTDGGTICHIWIVYALKDSNAAHF